MLTGMGVLPAAGARRLAEPPVTSEEVERVARATMTTVGDALSHSRWRSLEGAHRHLLEFREQWRVATGVDLPWDVAVTHWVSRKRQGPGGIAPSTALEYVGRARVALRRMGVDVADSQLLADFSRGLKREGALRPQRQAVPALASQVRAAIRREPCRDVQLALVLGWAGAARVSDVVRLRVRDVSLQGGYVAVNWSETKSDPFRLGVTTGVSLSVEWMGALRTAMIGREPEDLLLVRAAYRDVVRALKRVDPTLSGHSLRRGALQDLLMAGAGMESIRQVSRHASLDALARYLPAGKLELARQSAATTRGLGGGL